MKRVSMASAFILLLLTDIGVAKAAEPSDSIRAGEFVLDYDVPESPAFVALGMSPSNVLRASAAKPAVAAFINQFASGAEVNNGVALDFSPYFAFGGRLASIDDYRQNSLRRMLANTQLSLATVEDSTRENDLRFGLGLRITFFDSHDLLQNKKLGEDIDDALLAGAKTLPWESEEEILPVGTYANLKDVYSRARDRVRAKSGSALALGWATSGRVHSAIAKGDSIDLEEQTVWLSFRHSFGGGLDLLTLVQGYASSERHPKYRTGVGLRSNGRSWNIAGELYYDSIRGDALSGRVGLGANGEVRVSSGLALVAALSTEPLDTTNGVESRLRMRTSVRWNAGQ
jgi:hypothetical protein